METGRCLWLNSRVVLRESDDAKKHLKLANKTLILSLRARLIGSVLSGCSALYSWYLMRNSALSMGKMYFVNCIVVFLLSMIAMAYMFMSYIEDDFRKALNRRSVTLTRDGNVITYTYLAYESGECIWVSYRVNKLAGSIKYNFINGVVRLEGYFEKIIDDEVSLVNGTYDFLNVFGKDLVWYVTRDEDIKIKFENGINYTIVD